ncbi:MAG: FitA-like ribbon-helix-helix domain-containing protein [Spirochaetaceae bacterium]
MPSLILRDLPEEVHKRLGDRAHRHHRSMTKEAVSILERELLNSGPVKLPPVVSGARPIPTQLIDEAIEEGRE